MAKSVNELVAIWVSKQKIGALITNEDIVAGVPEAVAGSASSAIWKLKNCDRPLLEETGKRRNNWRVHKIVGLDYSHLSFRSALNKPRNSKKAGGSLCDSLTSSEKLALDVFTERNLILCVSTDILLDEVKRRMKKFVD